MFWILESVIPNIKRKNPRTHLVEKLFENGEDVADEDAVSEVDSFVRPFFQAAGNDAQETVSVDILVFKIQLLAP